MAIHLEYKLEALSLEESALVHYLSDQSAKGWELVTVIASRAGGTMQRLILRREMTNPALGVQGE